MAPNLKTISVEELAAVPAPPYLIEGFLRKHTITMLSSEPHTGKTMMMIDMLLCMEQGIKLFNTFDVVERSSSLFIGRDSPKWDIAGQIRKLSLGHGIQTSDLAMFDSRFITRKDARVTIFDAGFLDLLKEMQQEHGIKNIFFDTQRRVHNANENDSGEMGAVMEVLERLVDDHGFTIIFSTHTSKPMGVTRSTNYSARGSTVISGSVDFHYSMSLNSKEQIVLNGVSKRRGESRGKGNMLLEMKDLPGGGLQILPVESTAASVPLSEKIMQALALKPDGMSAPELSQATGISYWTLQKLLTQLSVAGSIKRLKRGVWALSVSS